MHQDLHSTMVLFKFFWSPSARLIYQIYIPLWSYSNGERSATLDVSYLFTFHYGPIQIALYDKKYRYDKNLHSTMVLFKLTFECFCCILDTDLHSTMVLFK